MTRLLKLGGYGPAVLSVVFAACAEGGSGSSTSSLASGPGCQPGASVECMCLDGTRSTQQCEASGMTFTRCQCPSLPTPPGATVAPGAQAGNQAGSAPTGTATPGMAPASSMDAAGAAGAPAPAGPTPGDVPPVGMAGSGAMEPPQDDPAEPEDESPAEGEDESESESDTETMGSGEDVPADCTEAADWDPMWAQFEEEVLVLTNEARAEGATCGEYGSFDPADPLTMQSNLRCAARLHSQDMGQSDYFAHDSLDGRSPFDRMAAAGYQGSTMGENIAKGQQSPDQVVEGWMNSPGHCANIMNPSFTEIGIGYWEGEGDNQFFNGNKLWTQNFGAPRPEGGGWPGF